MLLSEVYKSIKNEWSAIENLCLLKSVPEHVWIVNCKLHRSRDTGRDLGELSWVHRADILRDGVGLWPEEARGEGAGNWSSEIGRSPEITGTELKKNCEKTNVPVLTCLPRARGSSWKNFQKIKLEKVERLAFHGEAWIFYPAWFGVFSQKFGATEFMNKKESYLADCEFKSRLEIEAFRRIRVMMYIFLR